MRDARVIVFFNWYTTLHGIREIDPVQHVVTVYPPSIRPFGKHAEKNSRYLLENLPEFLDAPGEWYLNRTNGKLTYVPKTGETEENIHAVVPHLKELIRVEGVPEQGKFVEHIHFRGIRFHYVDWELPETRAADAQNHSSLNSQAVFARGLRHSSFEDCEIAHVGGYGLWLERGCQNVKVSRCHLHDLGAGGIRVGEVKPPKAGSPLTSNIEIENNYIHDSGNVFRAGVGVWITHSPNNSVTRNEISDLPYTGISVGWRWDAETSYAHHNLIEGNYIHNIGKRILSDLGGIYTLGESTGTVIRNNLIHDVESYNYGGWGMYGDANSSGILYEGNLCYRTTSGGFFQHWAGRSTVRNNVFAFSESGPQISRGRREQPGMLLTFENNVIYDVRDELVGHGWTSGNSRFRRNLYFVLSGDEPRWGDMSFSEWRATGQDRDSVVTDPLFRDASRGDFRLNDQSPARAMGIGGVDFDLVGLYGEREWVELPKRFKKEGGK